MNDQKVFDIITLIGEKVQSSYNNRHLIKKLVEIR